MFELLHQKFSEIIDLSEEEFEYAKTLFIPKKLKKKRILIEEEEICKYTVFVEKGLLRSFKADDKGNEYTLQFALSGWWTADLYSFLTNEPTPYNIEALEDSELLLITKPSWDLLLEKVPAFERYFRVLIQNNLINTQRRLMSSFTETAGEKYLKILKEFPDILQRVPQHMIASYHGITRETLSRTRNQITTRS
ncbi:MAG: Crp/Fnr family transcriptional regulator [Flavobacteriaceae bacterium]|nr:Crp/Fnr family transcriptional regulator [Flavobacteriaceae bacterium]